MTTTAHARCRRFGVVLAIALAAGCGRGGAPGSSAGSVEPVPLPTLTSGTAQLPAGDAPSGGPATAELSSPAGTEPYIGDLTFDWPSGCSVSVNERLSKKATEVDLEYELWIDDDGDTFVIAIKELDVLAFDGAAVPAERRDQVASVCELPAFRVGRDGVAIELVGIDDYIDRIVALTGDESARESYERPGVVALIEASVMSKYWGSWVGIWLDAASIDRDVVETVGAVATGSSVVATSIKLESLPMASDGLAVLHETQTVVGDAFVKLFLSGIVNFEEDASRLSADEIAGSRVVEITTRIDPATLRPASAGYSMTIDAILDGERHVQSETRSWTFDWANSDCAH